MKIYKNGQLIEIVKRDVCTDIALATGCTKTKTSRRSRLSKNKRGTNQYQAKRKENWKKTLPVGLAFLVILAIIFSIINSYLNPPIISPLPEKAHAQETENIPTPTMMPIPTKEAPRDKRAEKVETYLEKNKSPLANYSNYIVQLADEYDIPWTLVVAISGKESSFCKNIKEKSHNCWGIMTWDSEGNRSIRSFDSWESGIEYTTKLLSKNYRHDMNRAIQAKYCPTFECSDTWVENVTTFQEEINK